MKLHLHKQTIVPMKFLYPLLVALTVAVSAQAQTETPAVKSNTLDAQFTDVIEKSNRYQDYKVVKIFKLNKLRKNVNDTIQFDFIIKPKSALSDRFEEKSILLQNGL